MPEESSEPTNVCAFANGKAAKPAIANNQAIIRRMFISKVSRANLRCHLHSKGYLLLVRR